MRRTLAALMALALCLSLTACGHFVSLMPGDASAAGRPGDAARTPEPEDVFREQDLFTFLRWSDFAANYYDDTPVALSIRTDEGGFASPVFDRISIIAACDALRTMTVTGRAGEAPAAGGTTYTFTMDNGSMYVITFVNGCLSLSTGLYTVTGGDGLFGMAFPGYGGDFDVFDLYFSDTVRAFADNFDANTPLSIGRRSNGGATLASRDPAVVRHVFDLLANASVVRVEDSPDQNIDLTQTTDYIFTMPDESYVTFTFTGPCLAVTASADYGPVYYWLDGVDELPSVTILPESTVPTFSGGAIAGMREDIGQAQAAANGQLEGITVLGVYVDYNIQGQHGYLTLDGDTANAFIQQVTSINAAAETTAPIGDDITVFVTLSDQSGPIIVFTGDTVQQMVGTNHACDVNAMANLRTTIMTLAQDERNIGQVIGSSTG